MKRGRPNLKHVSVIAACVAGFVLLGHFAATKLIDTQRARQLHNLNDIALRRAETVVDNGRTALDEMAGYLTAGCDPSVLQALRLQVYQRSSIKDVRLINRDGTVLCSAFSETLEFDKGWVQRRDMLPSADGKTLLFRVDQFNGTALGIVKDISEQRSLVTIISLSAYVFDLLPEELRDHGAISLALNNGHLLASSRRGGPGGLRQGAYAAASARYPFETSINVEAQALHGWNTDCYWPIIASSVGLGILFGSLLATIMFRPISPVAELDNALASGAFKPYFLPTFDLRSGAIVGCEVLARWIKADGTVMPPLTFIPLAESSGRIEPLTWRIIEQALAELRSVLKQDRSFVVSFNVMPRHMVSDDFVSRLRAIAIAMRVSPRQIALEVTERDAFPDLAKAAAVVAELRGRGFSVALDDVGIGHNGLSQIHALGANVLKIDKFFIDSMGCGGAGRTTVEMLVRLAAEMKMSVVAEGIETEDQRRALIQCGVSEGQGYLRSPPLPAADFKAILAQQQAERESEVASAPMTAQVA